MQHAHSQLAENHASDEELPVAHAVPDAVPDQEMQDLWSDVEAQLFPAQRDDEPAPLRPTQRLTATFNDDPAQSTLYQARPGEAASFNGFTPGRGVHSSVRLQTPCRTGRPRKQ